MQQAASKQLSSHPQLSLFVVQEAVSKAALLAFRVFSNLARRTGRGFVRSIQSLLPMLGVSERRAWQLIAELKAAGWISWSPIRTKGQRGIEFAPLVKLPKQARGRFAPRSGAAPQRNLPVVQGPFSCPESAPSIALSNAKSCTLNPSAPYKTSPVGTEDDNRTSAKNETPEQLQEQAVAVSLLENVVSTHEAQELAKEAAKKALTPAQIEHVIAVYRAQQEKIRNRGAWLREAIRRGFTPAAAPASHPSEINPVENVKRVKRADLRQEEILPTVQPGADALASSRCPSLARLLSRRGHSAPNNQAEGSILQGVI